MSNNSIDSIRIVNRHFPIDLPTMSGTVLMLVDGLAGLAPHTVAINSRGDVYVGEVSWSWTKRTIDRGARVI